MERYWVANGILASNECGGLVKYDDAQRALDAEREKVKELECYRALWKRRDDELTGVLAQLAALQARATELERDNAAMKQLFDANPSALWAQLATLQAQLAAAKKVKADYDRWLSGGVYFTTAEYEKHVADYEQHVQALQAQLRQVEGERDQWIAANTKEPINEPVTYQALAGARFVAKRAFDELVKARSELSTLRQLVEEAGELYTHYGLLANPGYAGPVNIFEWIGKVRATLAAQDAGKEDVSHE